MINFEETYSKYIIENDLDGYMSTFLESMDNLQIELDVDSDEEDLGIEDRSDWQNVTRGKMYLTGQIEVPKQLFVLFNAKDLNSFILEHLKRVTQDQDFFGDILYDRILDELIWLDYNSNTYNWDLDKVEFKQIDGTDKYDVKMVFNVLWADRLGSSKPKQEKEYTGEEN